MAKSDMIEVEGVVVESLPNTTFQVVYLNPYIPFLYNKRHDAFIIHI